MFTYMGADPEAFLVNNDGKIISAIGKIGGTKDHPVPVKELGKGFALQEDNVLVEWNIPACKTWENVYEANAKMIDHLRKKLQPSGLAIKFSASEQMPRDQLEDPRAHVFGCDPDFNAWTMRPNARPHNNDLSLRSAGGHVHYAIKATPSELIQFVRSLDIWVGCWSVIHDQDARRRTLYGKAGAMRRKPYGVEYRVLSNFWVGSSAHTKMLWELSKLAWKHATTRSSSVLRDYGDKAVEAINTSNVTMAKKVFEELS